MTIEIATGVPDLIPTHSCFDDVIEFFGVAQVAQHDQYRFCIVHGICRGHARGSMFAHAWVEQNNSAVWQAGIERATGEVIYFALPRAHFYELYAVQQTSRYPVPALLEAMKIHNHSGPWRQEYRELCTRPEDGESRVVGMMRGLQPVAFIRTGKKTYEWYGGVHA